MLQMKNCSEKPKWFAQDHIHSKKQHRTSAQICLILRQLFFLLQLGWLTKSSVTKYKAKWFRCLFSGILMAKYIRSFRLLSVLLFKGQSNFITLYAPKFQYLFQFQLNSMYFMKAFCVPDMEQEANNIMMIQSQST